jgi:protein-tyrosine phosphatase
VVATRIAPPSPLFPPPPPTGRIDVHSHLLPGIDDGCPDIEASLECVRRLLAAGFVGSICTPHVSPADAPQNLPQHIRGWTIQLQQKLREAKLDYRVWPGGEVRLFKGLPAWLEIHGVPTLADSRCVLVDFWEGAWPGWVQECFEWLIAHRYQPILAHPERLPANRHLEKRLDEVQEMGVWLQGNFACFTGQESFAASQLVRQFIAAQRYRLMALDMHGPDTLDLRLDGLELAAAEFGPEVVDHFTITAPRQLIFGQALAP